MIITSTIIGALLLREKRKQARGEMTLLGYHDAGMVVLGSSCAVASYPESYTGQTVGNGQCVTYVKAVTGAPASSEWSEGQKVRGANLARGTAIATFQNGQYQNRTDGSSHAAIYLSQDADGIQVMDQWYGQPVHTRTIRFKGGSGMPVNDGDAFSVVLA